VAETTGESVQSGQKTWTKIRYWVTALHRIAEDAEAAPHAEAEYRTEAEDANRARGETGGRKPANRGPDQPSSQCPEAPGLGRHPRPGS
jgi:hypothetical protein